MGVQKSRREQMDILTLEILHILRNMGGRATRQQIKKVLRESSDAITEQEMTEVKISKNTGNSYKPFNFAFNFSLKNLKIAGYVEYERQGEVVLTRLGRNKEITHDLVDEVREIAELYWKEQRDKNRNQIEPNEMEEIVDYQYDWRTELLESLSKMSPNKFETFARALVSRMGVSLDENIGVKLSGDGGVDGFGYITSDEFRTTRVAVQAKRWVGGVSSPEIDKFRGAMDKHNAEYGIFITTSYFTKNAIDASRSGTRVITLIDGEMIADLVEKYKLYIHEVVTYELDKFYIERD